MKTYTITSTVKAEPEERAGGAEGKTMYQGYRMIFPNGEERWTTKEIFEGRWMTTFEERCLI